VNKPGIVTNFVGLNGDSPIELPELLGTDLGIDLSGCARVFLSPGLGPEITALIAPGSSNGGLIVV